MTKLKNRWRWISRQGVKKDMPLALQRKIELSNQIAVIFFLIYFTFSLVSQLISGFSGNILPTLSTFIILLVPLGNRRGHYRISALMISILSPFFFLLFSIIGKIGLAEVNLINYFLPRFILLALLTLPFILLDQRDRLLIALTSGYILALIFFIDPLHRIADAGFFQVTHDMSSYPFINYMMVFPVAIVMLGLIFLSHINARYENKLNAYMQQLKNQNEELEQQKATIQRAFDDIEYKNRQINDSITYAQKIQQAVLPSPASLQEAVHSHFVLLRPRDKVSGDFYWYRSLEIPGKPEAKQTRQMIAAADCTGHGVPGAFMSMLGVSFLKEIATGRPEATAGEMLDELRQKVKEALKQEGKHQEQKDGMDMALCLIDRHKGNLQFAGAHNSLYLIRKTEHMPEFAKKQVKLLQQGDYTLAEFKADRQPISVHLKERPFSTKYLDIRKGDKLYMFSDGFADQAGGKDGRKYMTRNFKRLLLQVHHHAMPEQKRMLNNYFEAWKKGRHQIDDVLVMGIKV